MTAPASTFVSSAADPPTGEISDLVRDLVRRAVDKSLGGEDVVLDLKVDGFRCVLTRVAPVPSQAETALSPREKEIARMVAKGYPNKTIAAVLEISSWTVSTHLRRIFAKLGVTSRAAMVARLIENGRLGRS